MPRDRVFLTGTSEAEKSRHYRKLLIQQGGKLMSLRLSAEALTALTNYMKRHRIWQLTSAINQVILETET